MMALVPACHPPLKLQPHLTERVRWLKHLGTWVLALAVYKFMGQPWMNHHPFGAWGDGARSATLKTDCAATSRALRGPEPSASPAPGVPFSSLCSPYLAKHPTQFVHVTPQAVSPARGHIPSGSALHLSPHLTTYRVQLWDWIHPKLITAWRLELKNETCSN